LQESEVLLLDGPTNNLNLKNQIEILKLIREFSKEKNILSILVMHDINLALRFCEKFIFMKDGKIEAEAIKKIVTAELIKKIYNVDVDMCSYRGIDVIIFKN